MNWKRQPQDNEIGRYLFDGEIGTTELVYWDVDSEDIKAIIQDVREFARANNGINKVQTYIHETIGTLKFIDFCTIEAVEAMTPEEREKKHWCLLRFDVDYSLGYENMAFKEGMY